MNVDNLLAIDVHTHAEVSCRQPMDAMWEPFDAAASKYFKVGKRPTIAETVAYYRERKIGLVMFTVDSEFQIGNRRIPNEEVVDAARDNADMMIAFASIDPHKGMMGVLEARDLIGGGIVKGFKFHPTSRSVPEHIHAVIDEVGLDKWGFAGKLNSEWRKQSERNEGDDGRQIGLRTTE
jgi:predicted TIM-barrel fold metal-dependent hydrolase